MKSFTKYFIILTVGIIIGYAWAYNAYMPHIQAHKTALSTYQMYFLAKDNLPHISATPHKVGRKYLTNGTN